MGCLYWNSLQSLVTDFKILLSVFILCLSVFYIIVFFPIFVLKLSFLLLYMTVHSSDASWTSLNIFFCLFVCFQFLFFITYICHRKISYYLLLLLYLFFPSFMHIRGLNFLAYQIDFLASETLFDSRSFTSLPRNSFSASNSVRAKLEHFYLSHICQCSFLLSFIKSTTKWEAHLDTTPNTLSESTFPLFPKQNHQQNLLNLLLIFRYTPILHFISFL